MQVSRIGLTPLKGARHTRLPGVDLASAGPVGDRLFALVDRARGRVLRTVEAPTQLRTVARWDGRVLRLDLPHRSVSGTPVPSGETLDVDYWGRQVAMEVVDGPWASACSERLGLDLVLARAPRPGTVVFGASVSLVTTSSLDRLGEECGGRPHSARFRATFTLDTGPAPAHVEDGWVGRRLRLGDAEIAIRSLIPRCAVVDHDPVTGERDLPVLKALGRYRRDRGNGGDIRFGVDAVVVRPGRVESGAVVSLLEGN